MSLQPDHQMTQRNYAPELGGEAASFIFVSSFLLGGWLGVKAGKNHYQRTHDLVQSTLRGVECGRRWTGWILGMWLMVLYGMFSLWMLSAVTLDPGFNDYSGGVVRWTVTLFLSGCVLWPIMGTIYVRNMDASLFRRGRLYRLLQPLAKHFDGWSSITLYAGFLVIPWVINDVLLFTGVV